MDSTQNIETTARLTGPHNAHPLCYKFLPYTLSDPCHDLTSWSPNDWFIGMVETKQPCLWNTIKKNSLSWAVLQAWFSLNGYYLAFPLHHFNPGYSSSL